MELESNFNLLNTIKVPKNMRYLADNLPKSKYEENAANNSFDNADPRLMGKEKRRNKENSSRPNKISSALPKLEKENSNLLPNIH